MSREPMHLTRKDPEAPKPAPRHKLEAIAVGCVGALEPATVEQMDALRQLGRRYVEAERARSFHWSATFAARVAGSFVDGWLGRPSRYDPTRPRQSNFDRPLESAYRAGLHQGREAAGV